MNSIITHGNINLVGMSITGSTFTQPKQAQGFTSFWLCSVSACTYSARSLSTLHVYVFMRVHRPEYMYLYKCCVYPPWHTECFALFATVTNPCSLLGAHVSAKPSVRLTLYFIYNRGAEEFKFFCFSTHCQCQEFKE